MLQSKPQTKVTRNKSNIEATLIKRLSRKQQFQKIGRQYETAGIILEKENAYQQFTMVKSGISKRHFVR